MCGLAGWVDFKAKTAPQPEKLQTMSCSLARRGPDDDGIYQDDACALVHRRLIVIDPEGGAQPMREIRGQEEVTLVYNGELYNTEELRAELVSLGERFHGHSDTEVLLKAYLHWGAECLQKLNGIYAFAVWEKHAKRLFAARDRVGVKPFFFYEYNGGLIFASEIKTLLASGAVPPEVDKHGLYEMLLLGPGRPSGSGCIKGIKELLPGEYLTFDQNGLKRALYWKLTAAPHTDTPLESVEYTRWLITDAITRQLVSDVPLACFLSGGLDSSIISAIAAQKYKNEGRVLSTYSVDYEDNDKFFVSNSFQPSADNKYIDIMSKAIGSNHRYIVLDNLQVAGALEDAALARDLPGMADIDSSLLLFCREIKQKDTVCVSGECADELFGGYPWYHNPDILFKEAFPWSNATELRQNIFVDGLLGADSEDFVHAAYRKTVDAVDYLPEEDRHARRMREMFALNFYWFMQTLLDRKDRMSMYSGLEVRVPFCDHRLVEYAFNMPWEIKSLNGREKGIMRRAFSDLLPQEITERKKSPYPKTFHPEFFKKVVNKTENLLQDKTSVLHDIVNKKFLESLKENPNSLKVPWYGQLMRVPQIYGYLIQLDTVFRAYGLKLV
ncbi:MAG: asparagine synthase (glutamine-hydrolyzing) [Clostridia bacterium]|nr:asparagine synthase (glutamine-hydrolyzing) [Clostridia bacterium]